MTGVVALDWGIWCCAILCRFFMGGALLLRGYGLVWHLLQSGGYVFTPWLQVCWGVSCKGNKWGGSYY